ncbi:MAG: DNA-processing protein DprA [Gammaproteobacteria bacterium]
MDDLADWLLLWRMPGIGPVNFRTLLANFGSPALALLASPAQLHASGLNTEKINHFKRPDRAGVERDLAWAAEPGRRILTWNDPLYPRALNEIPSAPPILFVNGNVERLNDPQLAIVGSRNPTPGGAETATNFAACLAAAGLGITSGLALGVDGAAHKGALGAAGVTVAVAATGPDIIYPARHRRLAGQIAERGAIVSEFPTGVTPRAENFPRRNRIISGLSAGTLVVEAARQSGSLITARLAAEQGREVFAIPGSIHNPMSKGCHHLIRQGAKLVETAEHILEELAGVISLEETGEDSLPASTELEVPLDADYQRLLDALGYDPTPVDAVVERSGLTAEAVSSMLLLLELQGHIASVAGGMYARLSPETKDERHRNRRTDVSF